jgi:hypothetical protein
MKKRYIYTLLFGVPGLVIALVAAVLAFGTAIGFLWLYVFGDSPSPQLPAAIISALFGLVFLGLWFGSLVWGWVVGKRLEADPVLDRRHIFWSVGVTLAVLLLIVLHQFSVGNLGPKSDSQVCSDYCREQGYHASELTPRDAGERICSCLDSYGRKAIGVELERLAPKRGE